MHKLSIIVALLLTMTGCASLTGEKMQSLRIQTIFDNEEIHGVGCTMTNDAGSWVITTPAIILVRKSTDTMTIDCKKGTSYGHETSISRANTAIWGNLIIGGLAGYTVDRNTGLGFDYPNTVIVVMHDADTRDSTN